MKTLKTLKTFFSVAVLATVVAVSSVRAQSVSENYAGNQNTSFGGAVGNGSLQVVNDSLGAINFTYTRGSSNFDNPIVIYIDSQSGGATSTSGFTDTADGLRRAISGAGFDNSTPVRSTLNFAAGFGADYALALSNSFAGLWSLSNPTSFPFQVSAGLSPSSATQTEASYTFGITAADIGLTANSGDSFSFFSPISAIRRFGRLRPSGLRTPDLQRPDGTPSMPPAATRSRSCRSRPPADFWLRPRRPWPHGWPVAAPPDGLITRFN